MKFMIVVFFAVILAANARRPKLSDIVKAYEETNTIGEKASVANQDLFIRMTPQECADCNQACNAGCQADGFKYGTCTSPNAPCNCYGVKPSVADHVLYIPTTLNDCAECITRCEERCQEFGYKYGICTSAMEPCSCTNKSPSV